MNQAFSKIWIAVILAIFIAGGILAWQYLMAPVEEVVEDKTEWKTYSNPKTNFTFRYPKNWEIREEYFYKGAENPTVVVCRQEEPIGVIANCIQINMPQCTGVKWSDLPGGSWICVSGDDPKVLDVYEYVKGSFRATKDETADWKTYRNEKYGFEVKYPPGFSDEGSLGQFFDTNLSGKNIKLFYHRRYRTQKDFFDNYIGISVVDREFKIGDQVRITPYTFTFQEKDKAFSQSFKDDFFSFGPTWNLDELPISVARMFFIPTRYKKTIIIYMHLFVSSILDPEETPQRIISDEVKTEAENIVKNLSNQILSTFKFIK